MLETLKKNSFKKSLPLSVILIVCGLVLAVWNFSSAYYALAGYVRFEDLRPEELKNQLVEANINLVWDCYLEQGTKNTSTNRTTINYYWYVIATGDEYAMDYCYLGIKVPKKLKNQMDDIMDYYYENDLPYPDALNITGKVKKLTGKNFDYFHDFFTDDDFLSEEEFEEYTVPYYIDVNLNLDTMKYGYVILFLAGVGLVVWGIIRIVRGAGGTFMKRFIADYQGAGFTDTSVESDINSAVSFTKRDTIKIGRLCTYYDLNGAIPRAIPNNKILWAYQNTTTHRTNGIKTGVTYSVMIYVNGHKDAFNIGVPDEATAQNMLKRISDTFPWVVVGYSDDLKKTFNKDRAQFLQLRYNTVEHVAVEPGFEGLNN